MADHLPSLLYTSPSDFNQSCCCDSLFSTTRAASLASADRYLAFPPARAKAASWSRARAPVHVLGEMAATASAAVGACAVDDVATAPHSPPCSRPVVSSS